MLPSRGLRPLRPICRIPGRAVAVPRHFSSLGPRSSARCRPSIPYPMLTARATLNGHSTPRTFLAASLPAAIRFNSSTTSSAPPPTSTISPATNTSDLSVNDINASSLDNLSEISAQLSTAIAPDQIGYLKSLGIEYGYGVTASVQWFLEHIHVWGGVPWWAAIVITTITVRLGLLRMSIRGSDAQARMAALQPVLKPIQEKAAQVNMSGNAAAKTEAQQEYMRALQAGGVKFSKIILPLAWQTVVGFASFRLLRAMAALPVPELETGGFLWLQDLTVADPYYILPLAMGAFIHVTVKYGGESGATPISQKVRNLMMYGMPTLICLTTTWLPGALQLSFATATCWGVAQGYMLRQPAVRERLGIAPLVPMVPPPISTIDLHSRLNMAPTYQAPKPTVPVTKEPEPAGVLGGARKEMRGLYDEMKEKVTQYTTVNATANKTPRGKSKTFLRAAKEYEKRHGTYIGGRK